MFKNATLIRFAGGCFLSETITFHPFGVSFLTPVSKNVFPISEFLEENIKITGLLNVKIQNKDRPGTVITPGSWNIISIRKKFSRLCSNYCGIR